MSAEVVAAVALAHRRDWARVLAATAHLTRNLDLAEECTQDAYAQALQTWTRTGIPDRPGAWLTTIARNRARDVLRREAVLLRALPLLVTDASARRPDEDPFDDDRLRLLLVILASVATLVVMALFWISSSEQPASWSSFHANSGDSGHVRAKDS